MPTPNRGSEKSQTRKAETLLCWLFGHKFFPKGIGSLSSLPQYSLTQSIEALDTCIRCGVTRGELEKEHPTRESQPPRRKVSDATGRTSKAA